MPFGNGTGPLGQGPMTGRGLGYCAGYSNPGYTNPSGRFWGRGMAWRRGWWGWRRGRGWRWPGYYPFYSQYPFRPPTTKEEKQLLTEELKTLKEEMKAIEKRIEELKANTRAR